MSEQSSAAIKATLPWVCLDTRGDPDWTCITYDGTGYWCCNCLAFAGLLSLVGAVDSGSDRA